MPAADDLSSLIDTAPGNGTLDGFTFSCSYSLLGAGSVFGVAPLGIPTCTTEVSYTPDAGYVGPDSFTFHTSDGWDNSETAGVSIDVVAPPE